MLWVYGHSKYFNYFSTGTVFKRQNLTSTYVRCWRIKTVPALKGLIYLEGNCYFSSNTNVWTKFCDFFGDHFKFCWVIFIMTDWLEFCLWFFWQPFWIRHQISNRSPHWAFVLLNRYIFVCQMQSYSECPVQTCLSVDLVLTGQESNE